MNNEQLVNKYWDKFNEGDYKFCIDMIQWHIPRHLVRTEMYNQALEKRAWRLCVTIIRHIKQNLITVEMYKEVFVFGSYGVCATIILHIDKTLIAPEMFNKALEVKAFGLCRTIIGRIDETLITLEMFKEAIKHGKDAYDICQAIINRVGFGFLGF